MRYCTLINLYPFVLIEYFLSMNNLQKLEKHTFLPRISGTSTVSLVSRSTKLLILVLLILVGAGIGCAATKRALGFSNNLDITLTATDDVNINSSGDPSPILIRFYELREIQDFRKAGFESLFNNDQSVIGKHIVKREEYELKPGEQLSVVRVAKRDTRYIGIIARYNDVKNVKWRAIISLHKDDTDLIMHFGKSGMWASKY